MPKRTTKDTVLFVCEACGEEYIQWQGLCSNCQNWNTIKEFKIPAGSTRSSGGAGGGYAGQLSAAPIALSAIVGQTATRLTAGFGEMDRVLGGGVVPGSVILLGGDPGIGKSTLLLQVAQKMSVTHERPLLYVSGEESPEQIKLRAERLGIGDGAIQVMAATNVDQIQSEIEKSKPVLAVIDSIQTMYDPAFPSTPGSLVQVRESALRIQQVAKSLGVPVVLVGHITKEGTVAGPRTLEHLVDVVLYLEGDSQHQLRILRAAKNRFGDTGETGIFAMEEVGLVEVANPGSFLLAERSKAPGSVLSAIIEGSRPMLIEVQALATTTVFGYPRRTASGFDLNRLNLLLAVLQKHAGINLSNQDVFVNVVGGLRIRDTAVDAAVCLALASTFLDKPVPDKLCVIGEVGLAGELRRVNQQERRVREIEGLGYTVAGRELRLRDLLSKYLPQ